MFALNVVLLLAMAACPGGATIKCYNCFSQQDSQCADPMDRGRMQLTECSMDVVRRSFDDLNSALRGLNEHIGGQLFPHGDTTLQVPVVCQKIDLIGTDGRNHTARLCSLKDQQHGDLCQDFKSNISHQKVAYCGVCEEDGCNDAGRPDRTFILLAAVSLAPLLRRG